MVGETIARVSPMRLILALFVSILVGAAASAAEPAVPDEMLTEADVLILGEVHDDPVHHRVQARTLERMAALGIAPMVVFEMIPTDLQEALDDHLDRVREGTDGMAEVLLWRERGWADFELYRPVFQAALDSDLRVLAGDLPAIAADAVRAKGAAGLASFDQVKYGLDLPLPAAVADDLRAVLVASHCEPPVEAALPIMLDVQRARDGSMAEAVRKAAQRGPVVLIAGEGHARKDWGVPAVLARSAPHLRVVSVALGTGIGTGEGRYDLVLGAGGTSKRVDPCTARDG